MYILINIISLSLCMYIGIVGLIATGFFSTSAVTGNPRQNGVYMAGLSQGGGQLGKQIAAALFTIGWAGIGTYILMKFVDLTMGLRVSAEHEEAGLDESLHGETIHGDTAGEFTETGELKSSYILSQTQTQTTQGNISSHHNATTITAPEDLDQNSDFARISGNGESKFDFKNGEIMSAV